MSRNLNGLLGELAGLTHRLGRVAATSSGETTSPATWRTLSVLDASGPMRLGSLATASRVSQPTMTGIVSALVRTGMVERIPDSADGRAWLQVITDKGTEALNEWRARAGTALTPYFETVSDEEFSVLTRAVAIIGSRIGPHDHTDLESGSAITGPLPVLGDTQRRGSFEPVRENHTRSTE